MNSSSDIIRRPRQERARRRTLALLDATETLLRQKDFQEVTVAELAEAAGVSSGYLYTRFQGKDALLSYLVEEFQEAQRRKAERLLAPPRWEGVALDERLARLINQFLRAAANHRGLMRAIYLRGLFPGFTRDSEGLFGAGSRIIGWLLECRDEIRRPEPESAVGAAVFTLFATLQSALFLGLEEARLRGLGAELRRMIHLHLTSAGDTPLTDIRAALEET